MGVQNAHFRIGRRADFRKNLSATERPPAGVWTFHMSGYGISANDATAPRTRVRRLLEGGCRIHGDFGAAGDEREALPGASIRGV